MTATIRSPSLVAGGGEHACRNSGNGSAGVHGSSTAGNMTAAVSSLLECQVEVELSMVVVSIVAFQLTLLFQHWSSLLGDKLRQVGSGKGK